MSTPEKIGPYVVTGVVGKGGMGIVLRARHPRLPTEVAVKLLRADAFGDPEAHERFKAEVLALARIKHANVVPVLDSGRAASGDPYYVMPLVAGRALSSVLEDGPLPATRAATIVKKLALALETAHSVAAVIHRDLKPSNVIVEDGTGEPLLLDFGLAKRVLGAGEGDGPRTETGALLGTPEYMAPEQAQGIPSLVDARTDVYGLGALLYAILTGKAPHPGRGRSLPQVLADVMLKEPAPIETLAKETPPDLVAICRQALAKEKERRYVSAGELAQDLQRFLDGKPVAARPPGRLARWNRLLARHQAAFLVVLAVSVVTSSISVFFAVRAQRLLAEKEAADLEREVNERPLRALALLSLSATDERHQRASATSVHAEDRANAAEMRARLVEAWRLLDAAPPTSSCRPLYGIVTDELRRIRYLDEARGCGERAVERFPDSFDAIDQLHVVLHDRHEPCARAHALVRALALRRPAEGAPYLHGVYGEEALDTGDLEGFEPHFRAVNGSEGVKPTSVYVAAARWSYLVNRRNPKSFEVCRNFHTRILHSVGFSADLLGQFALCFLDAGLTGHQTPGPGKPTDWQLALDVDPKAALALIAESRVRCLMLDPEGASEAARAALAVSPAEPRAHAAHARALLLEGRLAEAIDASHRALKAGDEVGPLVVLGWALIARDRDDEAAAVLERARNPELGRIAQLHGWADVGLSLVLSKRGDMAAANAAHARAAAVRSELVSIDTLFFFRAAQEWAKRGDLPGARDYAARAREALGLWGVDPPPLLTDLERRLGVGGR